ncbi:magnesium transporter MgtE [Streptomyces sp. Tu 6176]|uniref:magnesium transporter MgtE N-terminal domain-containing protein n=1 Tax=Streptomyces sp. Tu 6176 TaxID=1470557 RepID=UPI00044B9A07|nr:CBS domain-containing protein [Streptomyces sp. Tu 6176]EYT81158.1 magnesium transporter MgtE [Streptomyces sp. Tu 6176]
MADRGGQILGRLADVIVRLRGADYPWVTGVVVGVGRRPLFVPVEQVSALDSEGRVRLASARLDLRPFERRAGEVLLRADVLGHRLIDVAEARLVRASDVELIWRDGKWLVSCVDTRRPHRLPGLPRGHSAVHGLRDWRDWKEFEPLIGHSRSALARRPTARIRRLRPAKIADLLEDASRDEEREILGDVRQDPELEADVFEELEEDRASRLLDARTDEEIAAVLTRMRADDAADAIDDLRQRRRRPVLDLLPPGQRAKVLTLMGYSPDSAGGLMGMDFLALSADATVREAVAAVRDARRLQPQALTTVHTVDGAGRLLALASLVALLQTRGAVRLGEVSETDPVRVGPDTDLVDVTLLMADYNLLTLPVVDEEGVLLGVITIDDVLEATLPEDWRRREVAPPPDAHRTEGPESNAVS